MSDSIRSQFPCNLLYHYELIASLNNCFVVLFFAGNDAVYARKFAKQMLQIRGERHCVMNSARRTIFSVRFELNEQYFSGSEVYIAHSKELILQAHCDQEEGKIYRMKLTDLLTTEFRISVCVKTANIRGDVEQAIRQTVEMLMNADIRHLQENLLDPQMIENFSGRMEEYEDVINGQFCSTQTRLSDEITMQNQQFEDNTQNMRPQYEWCNHRVMDLLDFGASGLCEKKSNLVAYDWEPSVTTSCPQTVQQPKFDLDMREFRYNISGRVFTVPKFVWNEANLVELAQLARQCRFSKFAEGRGYYYERFSKEQLGQALTALTSQQFLQKCVAALEMPSSMYRLVVIGPACVGNTIAATLAMFAPLHVQRYINYAEIVQNAVVCSQEPQNECADFSPAKCPGCGRYRHQIRALSSFIEVINSTLDAIDKEVLYDLLLDNWTLADTCREEVYYLPKRHSKGKYINQLQTVAATQRVIELPRNAHQMLYFEMRRCCDIAEKWLRFAFFE